MAFLVRLWSVVRWTAHDMGGVARYVVLAALVATVVGIVWVWWWEESEGR